MPDNCLPLFILYISAFVLGFSAVSMLLLHFVQSKLASVLLLCTFIAFGITPAWNACGVMTVDIYPTSVRYATALSLPPSLSLSLSLSLLSCSLSAIFLPDIQTNAHGLSRATTSTNNSVYDHLFLPCIWVRSPLIHNLSMLL